jgi:hypothetical protein
MVSLTDSELDCVMNAARPLDVSAREALLRKVATALASCSAIGDAWCTGLRRDSASIFSAARI